ncbi:WD repeat-containing protein 76 [Tanacetum coccineum]
MLIGNDRCCVSFWHPSHILHKPSHFFPSSADTPLSVPQIIDTFQMELQNNCFGLSDEDYEKRKIAKLFRHRSEETRYTLGKETRDVWGWDDSYIFVGNMNRGVDIISREERRLVTTLESPSMTAIPCRFDARPFKPGMLATATSETPLIHAARQGPTSTAKYLIEHGANLASSSELGATALHHVAGIADPSVTDDEEGLTPVQMAAGRDWSVDDIIEHMQAEEVNACED